MAEGWAKTLKGDSLEAYSAGVETHGLNPVAVQVMQEAGVDISSHQSKHLNDLKHLTFDYVVTVCDSASESCPLFLSKTRIIHHSFDDPPRLSKELSDVESLTIYRRVRDEIRLFIESLPDNLPNH